MLKDGMRTDETFRADRLRALRKIDAAVRVAGMDGIDWEDILRVALAAYQDVENMQTTARNRDRWQQMAA